MGGESKVKGEGNMNPQAERERETNKQIRKTYGPALGFKSTIETNNVGVILKEIIACSGGRMEQ
jgi:hypothetical protein